LASDITEVLAANKAIERFRGFRHMVNFNPTNDAEVTTDLLKDPLVKANFKVLEEADVSFELHLNPWQYPDALEILKTVPNLRVIIDHRGRPSLADLNGEAYLAGMKLFAALPNVHFKVSFFGFSTPTRNAAELALVVEKAQACINLFTPQRCMFATNFPVDNHVDFGAWTMKDLEKTFTDIAAPFSAEERAYLWCGTALTVYRMN
jgi:predicted TIM-barrel fold metal-dependent hydrolase